MNAAITSRQELLAAAQQILMTEGPGALSIRRLAKQLGISVGVVYNYFPAKADLLLALTERFWQGVFHPGFEGAAAQGDFLAFFSAVYARLNGRWPEFMALLAGPLNQLEQQRRQEGKAGERHYLAHMRAGFAAALAADKRIRPGVWTPQFDPETFAGFALDCLLNALRAGQSDPVFLLEVFQRILY